MLDDAISLFAGIANRAAKSVTLSKPQQRSTLTGTEHLAHNTDDQGGAVTGVHEDAGCGSDVFCVGGGSFGGVGNDGNECCDDEFVRSCVRNLMNAGMSPHSVAIQAGGECSTPPTLGGCPLF